MSLVRLLRAHALGHYTESFHDFGEFCCLSSVVLTRCHFIGGRGIHCDLPALVASLLIPTVFSTT